MRGLLWRWSALGTGELVIVRVLRHAFQCTPCVLLSPPGADRYQPAPVWAPPIKAVQSMGTRIEKARGGLETGQL